MPAKAHQPCHSADEGARRDHQVGSSAHGGCGGNAGEQVEDVEDVEDAGDAGDAAKQHVHGAGDDEERRDENQAPDLADGVRKVADAYPVSQLVAIHRAGEPSRGDESVGQEAGAPETVAKKEQDGKHERMEHSREQQAVFQGFKEEHKNSRNVDGGALVGVLQVKDAAAGGGRQLSVEVVGWVGVQHTAAVHVQGSGCRDGAGHEAGVEGCNLGRDVDDPGDDIACGCARGLLANNRREEQPGLRGKRSVRAEGRERTT